MRKCTLTTRCGFTLIELLVVIAIIAILAAILFPVFARAKAKAQQASCISSMKQAALAMIMYASDHADMLPFAMAPDPYATSNRWMAGIWPYTSNDAMVDNCPSYNGRAPGGAYGDRGMNYFAGNASLTQINYPTRLFLLTDATTMVVHFSRTAEPVDRIRVLKPNWAEDVYPFCPKAFHMSNGDMVNDGLVSIAFADGHVAMREVNGVSLASDWPAPWGDGPFYNDPDAQPSVYNWLVY